MYNGRQKVTRKDVAREAGVSETIVSYVLNKNRYVKEEKRQRVLEAVEKLQYQPNNIARALHGKGSRQILFIAEELLSLIHILLVVHGGGPTAVINASLYGVIEEAKRNPEVGKVYG